MAKSISKIRPKAGGLRRARGQELPQKKLCTHTSSMNIEVIESGIGFHPRNRHQGHYDFSALVRVEPELQAYITYNPNGQATIPFADPHAVKLLNKALLNYHYGICEWDIPTGCLCPPIPGRADYIHRIAELIYTDCPSLKNQCVRMLDIGVGANCIYPMIASVEYGWQVIGSDIDPSSIRHASTIIDANPVLKSHISCRLQPDRQVIFKGIIKQNERYVLTTCNPPFHSSLAEAQQGSRKKQRNLQQNQRKKGRQVVITHPSSEQPVLNFGGQKAELWCPGGEAAFLKKMALESAQFSEQVLWFSSLISKKENVRWMKKQLNKAGAVEVKIVEMAQGQKISRFIAWSFLTYKQRVAWSCEN